MFSLYNREVNVTTILSCSQHCHGVAAGRNMWKSHCGATVAVGIQLYHSGHDVHNRYDSRQDYVPELARDRNNNWNQR